MPEMIEWTAAAKLEPTPELPSAEPPQVTEVAPRPSAKLLDAPLCYQCGSKMQPAGSCYVCSSCGSTSGAAQPANTPYSE